MAGVLIASTHGQVAVNLQDFCFIKIGCSNPFFATQRNINAAPDEDANPHPPFSVDEPAHSDLLLALSQTTSSHKTHQYDLTSA